jgi:hypothetical protein
VVTESMIIGWCFVNLDKLGDARNTPVSELTRSYFVQAIEESEPAVNATLALCAELCCDSTHSVLRRWLGCDGVTCVQIKAFKMMAEKRLSGLCIVDKFGNVTDSLSVRDLKGIGADGELFTRLWEKVSDFKKKVRKHTPHSQSVSSPLLFSSSLANR